MFHHYCRRNFSHPGRTPRMPRRTPSPASGEPSCSDSSLRKDLGRRDEAIASVCVDDAPLPDSQPSLWFGSASHLHPGNRFRPACKPGAATQQPRPAGMLDSSNEMFTPSNASLLQALQVLVVRHPRLIALQCSAVQCSAVQCSAVQCSAVQTARSIRIDSKSNILDKSLTIPQLFAEKTSKETSICQRSSP